MQGYGLYWYCLELVAANVEKHRLTFDLEHDAEVIAHDTGIHYELVQEMMTYMVDLGLFENSDGRITCLKMALRTDDYTQKILRSSTNVPTVSEQCTDSVGTKSGLIEENRIEENRIDKNRTDKRAALVYPDWLNMDLWREWKATRQTGKTKYTQHAEKLGLTKLSGICPHGVNHEAVINQAIESGWRSFYPLKNERGNGEQLNKLQRVTEQLNRGY